MSPNLSPKRLPQQPSWLSHRHLKYKLSKIELIILPRKLLLLLFLISPSRQARESLFSSTSYNKKGHEILEKSTEIYKLLCIPGLVQKAHGLPDFHLTLPLPILHMATGAIFSEHKFHCNAPFLQTCNESPCS